MARGTFLTDNEKTMIDIELRKGLNPCEIGRVLRKSRGAIRNYISKKNEQIPTILGRPRSVDARSERNICRSASNSAISSNKIKNSLNLSCTSRTVRNVLNRNQNLIYLKMKSKPNLTNSHREKRLKFCNLNMDTDWTKIMFSDEKRFNLDGPDSTYYWHDKRLPEISKIRRQCHGGGIMVWAGFCSSTKTSLAFISIKINAFGYMGILREHLLPFSEHFEVFQQDNAPVHTAQSTQNFFQERGVDVMEWPACSPDLNPIENIWGMMTRSCYEGGRQYGDVGELKTAINIAWEEITQSSIDSLIKSMKNRLFECILKRGASTHY